MAEAATTDIRTLTVQIEPTERPALDPQRSELLAVVLPPQILTNDQYVWVNERASLVRAFLKRVRPLFDASCNAAYQAHAASTKLRAEFLGPLEAFEKAAGRLQSAWHQQQQRAQRDRELADAEQRAAEERKRLDREAKLATKQGDHDRAEALKNTPVTPIVVTQPSATPELAGVSYRTEWKWRPIGGDTPEARERAVKVVPREYLELDESKLNGLAKYKGTLAVPGIEFYPTEVVVRK